MHVTAGLVPPEPKREEEEEGGREGRREGGEGGRRGRQDGKKGRGGMMTHQTYYVHVFTYISVQEHSYMCTQTVG